MKAEWPSFIWKISGCSACGSTARSSRAPPMPSTISWRYARVLVAAVQVAGDPAVVLAILEEVGVQQVERHAADLRPPDLGLHGPAREGHADAQGRAGRVEQAAQWGLLAIEPLVALALVNAGVDQLAEVAVAVEQPHPDQR